MVLETMRILLKGTIGDWNYLRSCICLAVVSAVLHAPRNSHRLQEDSDSQVWYCDTILIASDILFVKLIYVK